MEVISRNGKRFLTSKWKMLKFDLNKVNNKTLFLGNDLIEIEEIMNRIFRQQFNL